MGRHLIRASITAVALASLIAACGGTTVTEMAGPSAADRCQGSLAPVPSLPANGGSVQASVTAARECEWTASSQASWLQVAPASGQGEATLTVTAAANPNATARSGSLSLNGQAIAVTQAGADCRFSLSPVAIEIGADGGRRSVQVTAPGGCAWTAQSPVSWIGAATPTGSGSGTAAFDIDENLGDRRTATVQVAGNSVMITQSSGKVTSPEPVPPSPTPPPAEPTPTPDPPTTDPCPPKGGGKDCKDRSITEALPR